MSKAYQMESSCTVLIITNKKINDIDLFNLLLLNFTNYKTRAYRVFQWLTQFLTLQPYVSILTKDLILFWISCSYGFHA